MAAQKPLASWFAWGSSPPVLFVVFWPLSVLAYVAL
jgi:hypothetical protein